MDTKPEAAAAPPVKAHGVTYGQGTETNSVHTKHLALIDAMISWSIANPGQPWTKCAGILGVSVAWCRMVASSDAFRARYSDVRDDLLQQCGILTLRDKINGALEVTIDRITEKAAVSESMGDLTDAAEVLLDAVYGKSGAGGGAVAPANVTVNAQVILQARDGIINREPGSARAVEAEAPAIQGESNVSHDGNEHRGDLPRGEPGVLPGAGG